MTKETWRQDFFKIVFENVKKIFCRSIVFVCMFGVFPPTREFFYSYGDATISCEEFWHILSSYKGKPHCSIANNSGSLVGNTYYDTLTICRAFRVLRQQYFSHLTAGNIFWKSIFPHTSMIPNSQREIHTDTALFCLSSRCQFWWFF